MLSRAKIFRLSLDWDRLSCELLLEEVELNFGRARRDSEAVRIDKIEPLGLTLDPPFSGLWPSFVAALGLIFKDCLGMALGLETATANEPALRILGVAGAPFFTSFVSDGNIWALSSLPSTGLVGVVGLEGVAPPSFFHFREKGEDRSAPFGRVPGGVVLPSCERVADCEDPLVRGLVPLLEERPPNLGSLDTMADLTGAFSSIRCQQRHGGAWNYSQLNYADKKKIYRDNAGSAGSPLLRCVVNDSMMESEAK